MAIAGFLIGYGFLQAQVLGLKEQAPKVEQAQMDITGIKKDIEYIKDDVGEVKAEIKEVKGEVKDIGSKIDLLIQRVLPQ